MSSLETGFDGGDEAMVSVCVLKAKGTNTDKLRCGPQAPSSPAFGAGANTSHGR